MNDIIKMFACNSIYNEDCYGDSHCFNEMMEERMCYHQDFICESCDSAKICGHCYEKGLMFRICPQCDGETKETTDRYCDMCSVELTKEQNENIIRQTCHCCDNILCVKCINDCREQQKRQRLVFTSHTFYCFDCLNI
jgi:hypothetical protein